MVVRAHLWWRVRCHGHGWSDHRETAGDDRDLPHHRARRATSPQNWSGIAGCLVVLAIVPIVTTMRPQLWTLLFLAVLCRILTSAPRWRYWLPLVFRALGQHAWRLDCRIRGSHRMVADRSVHAGSGASCELAGAGNPGRMYGCNAYATRMDGICGSFSPGPCACHELISLSGNRSGTRRILRFRCG